MIDDNTVDFDFDKTIAYIKNDDEVVNEREKRIDDLINKLNTASSNVNVLLKHQIDSKELYTSLIKENEELIEENTYLKNENKRLLECINDISEIIVSTMKK